MNILFLEGDMSRTGGTERMTAWLATELSQKYNVHIISLKFDKNNIFFPLSDAITHTALKNGNLLNQIFQIHKYIKKHKIDTVINVDTGMGIIGVSAAIFTKTKVITWEHSNFYNNWNSRNFPYLRKFAALFSNKMVVLTEKDKVNYLSNIRRCKDVSVIPNPMGNICNDYNINSKIILSIGLLCEIKRFDRIIPIAKEIFEKHPDWSWVICGDGPERKNLENQISENNLENKIILTGNVPNISDFYKNAAMFVLTSQMEGLPMVLLEAKAHKLPIVSFDIQTGPSDIIRDNQNGFLIEPYNIEKMAEKINLLIENDELRKQFSDNAVLDSEKFSSERIIEQWTSLLHNL